jgi:DNA repair protein RadC
MTGANHHDRATVSLEARNVDGSPGVGTLSPRTLSSPASVAELARDHYLLHTLISTGTQSASLVHPREVLGPALREGAAGVVLVHNHPSGDPTPSREDLRLTRQLADAATLLDVRLHDHVIIGNATEVWVSLAERALL